MKVPRSALVGAISVLVSLAAVASPVAASRPFRATRSSTTTTPDQVTFDSTIVSQYAGTSNDPSGTETTEIKATIPIAASGSGDYGGSAAATYAQATGTITEACTVGSTTGTTKEIEQSGTPTTFTATYTPGASNQGGTVVLNLGPFSGGLAETFQDIPGCGGFTVGNTTPRFLAMFTANHQSQLVTTLTANATFSFPMLPGAAPLPGASTTYAGTYSFTGGATNNNLTYSETTAISVFASVSSSSSTGSSGNGGGATSCKVPDVKGDTLAAAKTKIKHAGCAVGTVKLRKAGKKQRHHVLSESPRAGASKPHGTKVNLTVGK